MKKIGVEYKLFLTFTSKAEDAFMPLIDLVDNQYGYTHRIIRLKALQAKVGVSRSKIYEMLNPNSPRYDPLFPKPVKLSVNINGWLESQVDRWIELKVSLNARN